MAPRPSRAVRARCAPAAVAFILAVAGCRAAHTRHVARDPALRSLPLYFYPAPDSTRPPRAVVFFFGNDVGFWEAHQRLAERLAGDGYAVAGFDVKRWLGRLPDQPPARRDSAFAAGIVPIVERARHELHGDSVPLVIGGHSIGAEFAVWTAAHATPPGTAGVLMLGPGLRSHLRVTLSDMANSGEPTEPGSYAVPDAVAATPPSIRIALVRGGHDKYRYADSALLAAGASRARRFVIPLAGHSLKRLTLAAPVIEDAIDFLLQR